MEQDSTNNTNRNGRSPRVKASEVWDENDQARAMAERDLELTIRRIADQLASDYLSGPPNWEPLEATLPREWLGAFMWMGRVRQDAADIQMYKHGITRSYLNLDLDGNAYAYNASTRRYQLISRQQAIDTVFDGLEESGWTRETVYDDEFIAAKHKALQKAGWTVLSMNPTEEYLELAIKLPEGDQGEGDQD